MNVRTRFAPSPTGYMHVGNLRSAIFAYLIAKHNKGKFLLRIEDTDQKREVEGAIKFIYDTCNLCGLIPDEGPLDGGDYGPYIQSERLDLYQKYAQHGYTTTKTHTYPGNDGTMHSKVHTYWTQKGRLFIYELLKDHGILPLIEQESEFEEM